MPAAEASGTAGAVRATIVYWGPEGAGKTDNLRAAHARLRPDHRGVLAQRPLRVDPEARIPVLPIVLGKVAGRHTAIQLWAAPGAPERALARKQLLDHADGVVFVADARRARRAANLASFEELRASLLAGGRELADLPLVIQYNHRDAADAFEVAELQAKLGTVGAAVFEAEAARCRGVLETLTTISKRVVNALRTGPTRYDLSAAAPEPVPAAAEAPAPAAEADPVERARTLFDRSWSEITAELTADGDDEPDPMAPERPSLRVGAPAETDADGGLRLPLELRDEGGQTRRFTLRLRIETEPEPRGAPSADLESRVQPDDATLRIDRTDPADPEGH